MLEINEIKIGRVLAVNNEPYTVIKAEHHKMGRGGAVLKVKMRNLINGSILDRTFQGNEKAEEANTEKKPANFLYQSGEEAYFMDNENFEQFSLTREQVGEKIKFLKEGVTVDLLYFNGQPVAAVVPIKIALQVKSAPPGVKGNSAGNVNKIVELETGAMINAPMFINEGDTIIVNTDTEEYAARA